MTGESLRTETFLVELPVEVNTTADFEVNIQQKKLTHFIAT